MGQKQVFSDSGASAKLAKERLIWALQPLAAIAVALFWVLNPEVVDRPTLEKVALWGFMFGAGIGVLGYFNQVKEHFNFHIDGGEYRKNRVPAEFYWGFKSKTLYSKEKAAKEAE